MDLYNCELISDGSVLDLNNKEHTYCFVHNSENNVVPNYECKKTWKNFKLTLLKEVVDKNDPISLFDALEELCFHDFHWDWTKKYHEYNDSKRYDWFYLLIDGSIEAIALVSHPITSQFDGDNIFYIEYVAVAPWNRNSRHFIRKYSGLGSLFVRSICSYYNAIYNYRYGFALSAVPEAVGFYKKIGMTAIPELNEEGLLYFELDKDNANRFVKGVEYECKKDYR